MFKALVPLETANVYLELKYLESFFSNFEQPDLG